MARAQDSTASASAASGSGSGSGRAADTEPVDMAALTSELDASYARATQLVNSWIPLDYSSSSGIGTSTGTATGGANSVFAAAFGPGAQLEYKPTVKYPR